jgi:hypothetical protein
MILSRPRRSALAARLGREKPRAANMVGRQAGHQLWSADCDAASGWLKKTERAAGAALSCLWERPAGEIGVYLLWTRLCR